jgi:hypothetical protein
MENAPSRSEAAPMVVPSTKTFAPRIVSPVSESTTMPTMRPFVDTWDCAVNRFEETMRHMREIARRFSVVADMTVIVVLLLEQCKVRTILMRIGACERFDDAS